MYTIFQEYQIYENQFRLSFVLFIGYAWFR
jgi:hypothetical protein